jgi:hypothetical protein
MGFAFSKKKMQWICNDHLRREVLPSATVNAKAGWLQAHLLLTLIIPLRLWGPHKCRHPSPASLAL